MSRLLRARSRVSGRYALASAVVIALGAPSLAIAVGEGQPVNGGERNPSPNSARTYTEETEIIASTETYGTRQSNRRSGDGGGAIYGCRTNPGNEPCVRSNNLRTGRAFEFATRGREGGRIDVGDPNGAPFTTNATGVATGLNSDRVDGRDGSDLAATGDFKFAAVTAAGALSAGRGATAATLTTPATETFTVTFDRDVSRCSFTASPLGTSDDDGALGVAPGTAADTVVVDQPDAADPVPFHVQVVC